MSGYILCQNKKAERPYYIENISTNIYTIEELCYFLFHNLYLVDQTVINEGLCTWIQKELELPKLAAKLRPHLGKFSGAEEILYPIFKEINYLTYEELKVLNGMIRKLDGEPLAVREKKKGDALVENGMYVKAIRTYQRLLERDDLEVAQEGLAGTVYHNLGCAYSYLFQMEKAVDCFWKAYEEKRDDHALKVYLLAYRSIRTTIEYESRISELNVGEEVGKDLREALDRFAKRPEKQVYSQHVDHTLENLIRDYHRSTGS